MSNLCIDSNYRRQGVAQQFFHYAFEKTRQLKLKEIEVDVYQSNRKSKKLCEQMGFRTTKQVKLTSNADFNVNHMERVM